MFAVRVFQIQRQLKALGADGQPIDRHLLKSARTPMLSTCGSCKRDGSFLTTICTLCKKHTAGQMELMPYLDWRKVVLKQQQLDAAEKKKPTVDAEPSDAASLPAVAPASPNKRLKASPSGSPSSSKKALSSSELALADISSPSAEWIDSARESMSIRAIKWIGNFMMKCPKENFAFSGGDIIFLLRNAIFKGEGEVAVSRPASQQLRLAFCAAVVHTLIALPSHDVLLISSAEASAHCRERHVGSLG